MYSNETANGHAHDTDRSENRIPIQVRRLASLHTLMQAGRGMSHLKSIFFFMRRGL